MHFLILLFSVFQLLDAMNLCLTLVTHGFEDISFRILKSFNNLSRDNVDQGSFFLQHCVNRDMVCRTEILFFLNILITVYLFHLMQLWRWQMVGFFTWFLKNKRRILILHITLHSKLKFTKESCLAYVISIS